MHDRSGRMFTGLGVLVVVWVVVYWTWPVGEPGVTSVVVEPAAGDRGVPAGSGSAGLGSAGLGSAGEAGGGPAGDVEHGERALPGGGGVPGVERAAGGVVAPVFRDYVIKSGDIGWERISERVYGSRAHWRAVAGANPLLDPRRLRIGMVIRVPEDPANVQGVPVEPADGGAAVVEAAAGGGAVETEAEEPTIEYTVEQGDSLTGIAKSFYGSIRYVDFLFDANRDRLRSKDDLRLGQVLLIPPLPAGVD